MTKFQYIDFKNLCYQIETILNRTWLVVELSGENYPKSFYFAKYKSDDFNKSEVILLCNKREPIFAFVDPKNVRNLDAIESGYMRNEQMSGALRTIMNSSIIQYDILNPEILSLEFNGKADFENKLKLLGMKESDIEPTIRALRLDLFNYKLFHGHNIGLDLFNSEED